MKLRGRERGSSRWGGVSLEQGEGCAVVARNWRRGWGKDTAVRKPESYWSIERVIGGPQKKGVGCPVAQKKGGAEEIEIGKNSTSSLRERGVSDKNKRGGAIGPWREDGGPPPTAGRDGGLIEDAPKILLL